MNLTILVLLFLVGFQIFLKVRKPDVEFVNRESIGGSNGRATAFNIKIADDLDAKNRVAVFAQELYDWTQITWFHCAILKTFFKKFRRGIELMGHEIEVQAYDGDKLARRWHEVQALKRAKAYKGLFDNWSLDKILTAMEKRSSKAAKWVEKNRKLIDENVGL